MGIVEQNLLHKVSHVGNNLNADLNEFLIPYLLIYCGALA